MEKLVGIGVSPGVAIGHAWIVNSEGLRVSRRSISAEAVDEEIRRLDSAIADLSDELAQNRDTIAGQLGEKYGAIFEAHRQLLQDSRLHEELVEMIAQRHHSAEYAVCVVFNRYADIFRGLKGHRLAERASDIQDLQKRLVQRLLGSSQISSEKPNGPVLVLAHNLTPSETANLDTRYVLGFVTEVGGPGGHTAIVAEALEIPAVVGTGSFLDQVSPGDLVIVDGTRGEVILAPDADTLARYQEQAERWRRRAQQLSSLRTLPAETRDGVRIFLLGNIEFPSEVDHCLREGADGIGLYRTEFLYLNAQTEPDEEDHFRVYRLLVERMEGRPVTIRTFDLGADKVLFLGRPTEEKNPFLGLRSIRLSLHNVPMFRRQLRAILRASAYGDIRVMFPLITTLTEFRQAKMILHDVMEDLTEQQIPFNKRIPVGMMVEVPAAVMLIDQFVEEADFLSIGTNDLIQYTLAVDRSNRDVVNLYNASDPAVLKFISMTVTAAQRAGKPVSLCGQMSANPLYTMLLIGLGLRHLSVPPMAISEVKKVCRSVTVAQCEEVARQSLAMESAQTVDKLLRGELKRHVADLNG